MINFFIIILTSFICLTLQDETFSSDNDKSVFALLFIREDHVKKIMVHEIYPVSLYSKGIYKDASVSSDSVKEGLNLVLNEYKDFTIFQKGVKIGELQVTKIQKEDFDCNEILVGIGNANISGDTNKILPFDNPTRASSFKEGRDISYVMKHLVALNSDSRTVKTQKRSSPLKTVLSQIQKDKLLEIVKQKYGEHKIEKKFLRDIKIKTSKSYDLNGNGAIEHILITTIKVEDGIANLVIFAKIEDNNVVPLTYLFDIEYSNSWGKGYDLVDVLDIDGNGIPEVILEFGGYEVRYFEIYQFNQGKFQKVFSGAGYGC